MASKNQFDIRKSQSLLFAKINLIVQWAWEKNYEEQIILILDLYGK